MFRWIAILIGALALTGCRTGFFNRGPSSSPIATPAAKASAPVLPAELQPFETGRASGIFATQVPGGTAFTLHWDQSTNDLSQDFRFVVLVSRDLVHWSPALSLGSDSRSLTVTNADAFAFYRIGASNILTPAQ